MVQIKLFPDLYLAKFRYFSKIVFFAKRTIRTKIKSLNMNRTSDNVGFIGCQEANRRFRKVGRVLLESRKKKKTRPDIICKEISRKGTR